MFLKIYIFNRIVQATAGAFLLALIIAGILGITRVSAASSTTNAADVASLTSSNSCVAGMQLSDYYLRQEEAILSLATQSNRNAAELASLTTSNSCVAGLQSSDYYLRQEEAILSLGTQSNRNAAELASLGGSNSSVAEMALPGVSISSSAGMQANDYYIRQEEVILSLVTQSNWNAAELASLSGSIATTQTSH